MKNFILTIIIALTSILCQAQSSDLKGIAVSAIKELWVEDGEVKTGNTDQCYTFSFNDNLLCHTVYSEGYLSASQFYTLSEVSVAVVTEGTKYSCDATSGISGNTYHYEILLDADNKFVSMLRVQPDKVTKSTYTGSAVETKTIKQ